MYSLGVGNRLSGVMSSRRGGPSCFSCGVNWSGPINTGGRARSCRHALPNCPWDAALSSEEGCQNTSPVVGFHLVHAWGQACQKLSQRVPSTLPGRLFGSNPGSCEACPELSLSPGDAKAQAWDCSVVSSCITNFCHRASIPGERACLLVLVCERLRRVHPSIHMVPVFPLKPGCLLTGKVRVGLAGKGQLGFCLLSFCGVRSHSPSRFGRPPW